ncbi:MAG: ABC transporter, partial [Thermoprotei archaeon]
VFHLSAYDHLRLFMDLTGGDLDLALRMVEDLGLTMELLRKRKPWELSAGQQKAFSTVIALSSRAKHVLLDEPFEQLDPARKGRLVGYLREYKGVVVLNTHETWLLSALKDWDTHLMFEGRVYGPLSAGDLVEAGIVPGSAPGAILRFTAAGRTYSLVRGGVGEPVTKLVTLDKVYELSLS